MSVRARMPVNSTDADFCLFTDPEPVLDDTGVQRKDRRHGEPLWKAWVVMSSDDPGRHGIGVFELRFPNGTAAKARDQITIRGLTVLLWSDSDSATLWAAAVSPKSEMARPS